LQQDHAPSVAIVLIAFSTSAGVHLIGARNPDRHHAGHASVPVPSCRRSASLIVLGSTLFLDNKRVTTLGNPGIVLTGNDLVRPVTISAAQQVSLSDLIIQRGAGGYGAGILSAGILALTDVVLRNKHASNRGGALFVSAGRCALLRVEFSENSAVADGGALMDVGTGASSIADSRLLNNISTQSVATQSGQASFWVAQSGQPSF